MTLYTFLKFLHVFFAIIGIGFIASSLCWLTIARHWPENLGFVMRTIQITDKMAVAAYLGLVITGPWMVWLAGYPWKTFWIWMALVLLVIAGVLGAFVYTPVQKQQIEIFENEGAQSLKFQRLTKEVVLLMIAWLTLVIGIVFLMATKPTLGG
jgi:uncharacterized membrane protein